MGERALVLGKRLGAEDVIVHALSDIGTSLYFTQPERGLALIQESLRRALAANLSHAVCRGYANSADALHHLDRYAEAHAAYQAFVAYAERLHMGMYAHYARAELFHLEWLHGDWSAWQRHQLLLFEPISGEVNLHIGTAFAGTYLGQAHNDLGQAEAAPCLRSDGLSSPGRSGIANHPAVFGRSWHAQMLGYARSRKRLPM